MLKQFESNLDIYFRKKKEYRQFCKLVDSNDWKSCGSQLCKSVLLPSCAVDEWGFVTEGRDNSNEFQPNESQSKHHNSQPFSSRSLAVERYADFLSVFSEHTRTLLNFFNQAGRIMAVNSNLGRKAKTELDKKSILNKVEELKIGYVPRVSVINLIDSSKNLHLFQREFRILLSNFVRDDYLMNLEREEKEIINRILVLWFFFCFHPEKNVQNAYNKFQPQIDKKIRQYKQILENTLKANYSDINIKVIEQGFLWNDKKALFLIFDSDSPEEIYLLYQEIIDKIKDVFHSKEETGIGQNIFEIINWSEIITIPLLEGKSLNCLAWRLDLLTLLYKNSTEELDWWNHVQQPIPSEVLEQLNIPIWNNPNITLGNDLLASISQQLMFMLHLLNIQQIEDDILLDLQD